MVHNRKLVIGGVGLTMARLQPKANAAATERVRNELEQELVHSGYFVPAPFDWVSLIIRKGLVDETEPHFERISRKHRDLPLTIEVDTNRLISASEDEMAVVYRRATLLALISAGERYGLPTERLKELLGRS